MPSIGQAGCFVAALAYIQQHVGYRGSPLDLRFRRLGMSKLLTSFSRACFFTWQCLSCSTDLYLIPYTTAILAIESIPASAISRCTTSNTIPLHPKIETKKVNNITVSGSFPNYTTTSCSFSSCFSPSVLVSCTSSTLSKDFPRILVGQNSRSRCCMETLLGLG